MNVANKAVVLACILLYVLYLTQPKRSEYIEGFRTKCFSCEAQDRAMGIDRDYGSKCFSCEAQDRAMGIDRAYGSKCFSCEAQSNDWMPTG
jgi:hypothetical protein